MPLMTTAHMINRIVAVLTKGFLCVGPFKHNALIALKIGIWVTIQSNDKFASLRINLLASAVLHSKIPTISSNS